MLDAARTTTTTALLEGLADPADDAVWRVFDDRYRPVILALARRLGLDQADAADVAQETLAPFVTDYRAGKYDRERGRLGAWITGIARHRIADLQRSRARRRELRGESAIVQLPADENLSRIWDQECREAALCRALEELAASTKSSPQTLKAFKRHVIQERPVQEVAEEMGMTVQAVYMAKHRCLTRLRELLPVWNAAYEVE